MLRELATQKKDRSDGAIFLDFFSTDINGNPVLCTPIDVDKLDTMNPKLKVGLRKSKRNVESVTPTPVRPQEESKIENSILEKMKAHLR